MIAYRRLGRTGLHISCISLGTVDLGLDYGVPGRDARPDTDQAAHLLNRALDLGVNFIDTTRVYGTSEELIGRALRARRSEYILASKVAAPPTGMQLTGQSLRRWVADSIATSLGVLQTDVIDLLQIHSATLEIIRRREIIAAIEDARQAGSVRFTGATTYGEPAPMHPSRMGATTASR